MEIPISITAIAATHILDWHKIPKSVSFFYLTETTGLSTIHIFILLRRVQSQKSIDCYGAILYGF